MEYGPPVLTLEYEKTVVEPPGPLRYIFVGKSTVIYVNPPSLSGLTDDIP